MNFWQCNTEKWMHSYMHSSINWASPPPLKDPESGKLFTILLPSKLQKKRTFHCGADQRRYKFTARSRWRFSVSRLLWLVLAVTLGNDWATSRCFKLLGAHGWLWMEALSILIIWSSHRACTVRMAPAKTLCQSLAVVLHKCWIMPASF